MDNRDREAIEGLFRRLSDVERQAPPRDIEAESLIQRELSRQPGAPYYMAQTIIMQEIALEDAQRRIEELERGASQRASGGFLSGLFGGGETARPRGSVPSIPAQRPAGPFGGYSSHAGRGGGGFLAGAAQTAMGVAGGVLLGNAIAGMFDGGDAQAADAAPDTTEDAAMDADTGSLDFDAGDMDF